MSSICYQRIFVPGCYYHIYNRGAHQQLIFKDDKDYQTFVDILGYYLTHPNGIPLSILSRKSEKNKVTILAKTSPSCSLLAYCLMPNHFHLMLRQESSDLTISDLMRRICVGYAMYFNERYHHSGTIFQGRYKNILVTNEYQWIYLSKYIHRNPLHLQSYDPCKLSKYRYSSYPTYLGLTQTNWLDTSTILDRHYKNKISEYQKFVENGGDVGNIEKITIDVEEDQELQGS
jgi:REP element-mobilizing transposase RayT